MLLQQADFVDRVNFGPFLNVRGLSGHAVEIGTHQGLFAAELLHQWEGTCLYCVDPWEAGYDPMDPASHGDREADYRACCARLGPFGLRARILRARSADALGSFGDGTLDFVYVDGNHQSEYVFADLCMWWPKLRPGGILAGHDIVCPGEVNGSWGRIIQPVVFDFATSHKLTIYLVVETTSQPWSYYLIKP